MLLSLVLLSALSSASHAQGTDQCRRDTRPAISFVELESFDLVQQAPLVVKGKLKLPARWHGPKRCHVPGQGLAAVVILHGSYGIDFRGEFYAEALNAAGIATLEIDMWEARGVVGTTGRPPLPLFTYPDAFAALAFLSSHPNIDPERIGILGFSWGGVMAMASATELYSSQFGGDRRFKAHVAHYPVCYAYNSGIPGTEFGSQAPTPAPLTGAPVLIQIGERDDYDEGPGPCFVLQAGLTGAEQELVDVAVYPGVFHAWDRLLVPVTIEDPFAHRGAGGQVVIVPDVDRAYESRRKAVSFFLRNL